MKKIFSIFAALLFAGSMMATVTTYQHVFTAKPSTGTVTLSEVSWSLAATNLGNYNSGNYAGVQFGTSSKTGAFTLTSSYEWGSDEFPAAYKGKTEIKEVRLWLNKGVGTVTPTVTIGGKDATSDGTTVTKKSDAGSDYSKATKVTFTPATDGTSGTVVIDIQSTNAGYICAIEIDCEEGETPAVYKPVISAAADPFVGSTTVTITCATTGATIYYTTNGEDPTDASKQYTIPFSIDETTTIKAFAINGTDTSKIAEKTFTAEFALTTMDQIFEEAQIVGTTGADRYITFNNWLISGVKSDGKTAYVTDGTKGFMIYTSTGTGFHKEEQLSGTVKVNLKLFKGAAEIVGLTSTTTGLTVTTGVLMPTNLDAAGIAALSGVNTGGLFTIEGAYESKSSKDYVANLQVFNSLYDYAAFEDGYNYTVTGVYQQFDDAGEILPRSEYEIEKGGVASRIIADDIDFGEVVVGEGGEWRDTTLEVSGDNLGGEEIVIFNTSSNVSVTDPVGTNLPTSGGTISLSVDFTKAGNFQGTITLQAGAVEKIVKITAKVIKHHEIPAGAGADKMTKGASNAYDVTVRVPVNATDTAECKGVRVGTGSNDGTMTITVGEGAQKLFFYAAAWTGVPGTINISAPAGVTLTAGEIEDGKLTLIADAGITGNSNTYKLDKKESEAWIYLFEIELDGVTANTDITLSSGSARRFVVWGAVQVGGTATSIENAVVNENKAVKQIQNGQVIILRNGVRYNVIGQVIE